MRSLLLALDDTPAGITASAFALSLAKRYGAAATGAAVLDVAYLTAPEPGGLGTTYYKYKTDLAHLDQGRAMVERLCATFLQQSQLQGVKAKVQPMEGRPWEQLSFAAGAHDIVLIGRDSNLHGEPSGGIAKTAEKILRNSPRPLLITPAAVRGPSRILVAYDGSPPAARTLQLFVLLGLAANATIDVISVNPTQDQANSCARQASTYLGLYDIPCRERAIASHADPAGLVLAEAEAISADLLVMGAYGHRGWKEALLGSFTTHLLAHCPAALFIAH